MKTSALIVEMVIVGFQVMIWLGLLIWKIDPTIFQVLTSLNNETVFLTFGALGAAYTIGSIFDAFTARVEDLLPLNLWPESRRRQREVMADLMIRNPTGHEIMYSRQLQARLLRSTAINSILIALVGLLALGRLSENWSFIFIIIVAVILAVYAWWRRLSRYLEQLTELDDELIGSNNDSNSKNHK